MGRAQSSGKAAVVAGKISNLGAVRSYRWGVVVRSFGYHTRHRIAATEVSPRPHYHANHRVREGKHAPNQSINSAYLSYQATSSLQGLSRSVKWSVSSNISCCYTATLRAELRKQALAIGANILTAESYELGLLTARPFVFHTVDTSALVWEWIADILCPCRESGTWRF